MAKRELIDPLELDSVVDLFRLFSDKTRLRILLLLYHKELCVCELCDILEMSQPKVSRHLAKLKAGGHVKYFQNGQWVFYYLNTARGQPANQLLDDILEKIYAYINAGAFPEAAADIEKLHQKEKLNEFCDRGNK